MTANVLHWGTGAVNVDATRVEADWQNDPNETWKPTAGRFPPNLLHDGSAAVVAEFPVTTSTSGHVRHKDNTGNGGSGYRATGGSDVFWNGDTGSAARFYPALPYDDEDVETARFLYCAKASKRDRDEGCEGLEAKFAPTMGNGIGVKEHDPETATPKLNGHPTVKPTAVMSWLVRLITPPGGVILDPFLGSGSTLKAAVLEGFNGIGIEQDAEYLEIARRRIAAAQPVQLPLLEADFP